MYCKELFQSINSFWGSGVCEMPCYQKPVCFWFSLHWDRGGWHMYAYVRGKAVFFRAYPCLQSSDLVVGFSWAVTSQVLAAWHLQSFKSLHHFIISTFFFLNVLLLDTIPSSKLFPVSFTHMYVFLMLQHLERFCWATCFHCLRNNLFVMHLLQFLFFFLNLSNQ